MKRGTLYLLHFSRPLSHAKHYLGFTTRTPEDRLREHLEGKGSPLVKAAVEAGIDVTISRTWRDKTRSDERSLKNQKNGPRLCPCCNPRLKE